MDPLLLLSLVTLGLTAAQSNNLKYMVTLPADMAYPSNEKVCTHITSPDAEAKVTVSMKTNKTRTDLSVQTYKGDGQLKCVPFNVPAPTGGKELAEVFVTVESGALKLSENKSVLIRQKKTGMFIQTDRPIFQPGEKILIRASEFDESMKAKDDNFTEVTIQDSQGNKIHQWRNVKPNKGILELIFNLSLNIPLGDYKITAEKKDRRADNTFTVDKYVLPRLQYTMTAPTELSIVDTSFTVDMCAKYTFNKPVKGNFTGKICRSGNANEGVEDICQPISGQSNVRGCYSRTFNTGTFRFKQNGYHDYIKVTVSLEDNGTGEMVNKETIILITDLVSRVSFPESRSTYKSPIPHHGLVTLTRQDGSPIPDEDIEIRVNGKRTDKVFTTDENGVARFSLDTAAWTGNAVNIEARFLPHQPAANTGERAPINENGYMTLISVYTHGKSQLKIRSDPAVLLCREVMNLFADISLDASEHTQDYINFDYLVFSKGRIIQNSRVTYHLAPNSGSKGFFSFPVNVNAEMSPSATIFLYASLSKGNLLTDSLKIPVTSCFPNPVSLQFSVKETVPGSDVSLLISALPNSLCNIRAVDKKVFLLKSEGKLPEDTANEYLKVWDVSGYPAEVEELRSCPPGTWPAPTDSSKRPDTYSYFESARIKALTNYDIRKPLTCDNIKVSTSFSSHVVQNYFGKHLPISEIRKDFPPTWMMQSVLIGPSGQLDYRMKTPDSITQWIVDGICASTKGLGFSPKTHIDVSKPYFLNLIVPPSAKQGETVVLKGHVLNYRRQCIKVNATLFKSEDFQLEPCPNCVYTACLCDNPSYTFVWYIKFLKLGHVNITVRTEVLETTDLCDGQKPVVPNQGRSDTVQKRLLVEAHGNPKEITRSMLICAFEKKSVTLTLPKKVVLGSQSAEATMTGDIMGKPLNNLENLVKMPRGCGEQNMILLAPTVATMKYLDTTGQLTDEIMERAKTFMEAGYQNQLNYKHDNGSYSTFGKRDPSGSTWLTGFVVKVFFWANKYIFVDEKHINEGVNWLRGLQQKNGCFKNMGKLVHKELQGGQNSEISLTAYVVQALLEIGDDQYDDVVAKAETCLQKCLDAEISTYAKALCAHTFTLAGDTEKRKQLLKQLDTLAIKKDNETHWTKDAASKQQTSKAKTGDVEITSYVLLAYTSEKKPSKEDLGAAVPIVRWLTAQQTANGGMQSTQETVVALSALSTYGMHTFTAGSSPIMNISNDKGFKGSVSVKEDKLTEVHKLKLPHIPANYTLEMSGAGCAYVQIIERFNIEEADSDGTFSLNVATKAIHCSPHPVPSFKISLNASYNNEKKDSNMAIVIAKMVTGFVPVRESVNKLLAMDVVKRVESSPSEVVIYLNQVGPTPIQFHFLVEQTCIVKDQKTAMIKLMDYYETDHRIELSYNAPCN